ncbi:MAG: EamA family transporter [Oscillospiraceae bacterium]|nr:EamA family transporter [Oscillospiraceae bacterium]
MWIFAACGSAFFAGITAILAKCGIRQTDSDVATALRTIVVFLFSWLMVFITGSLPSITQISLRSLVFLVLSGVMTGLSWICYFKALSMGDVNKVVPIDKSSTILTVLSAMILFGETNHWILKLICTALLGVGVLLMIEKKAQKGKAKRGWLIYAVLSAVFAAATSIIAKIGITGVESNLGTAIRTGVVLLMAWLIVFARKKTHLLKQVPPRELGFLTCSGISTGASWLCYYYAIQNGAVSVVIPIDKMSIVVSIAFSYLVFGEKLSRRAWIGLGMMVAGTLVMAIFT